MKTKLSVAFFLFNFYTLCAFAQSLPVSIPMLDNYFRERQLLGKFDSSVSFSIRPLSDFSGNLNTLNPHADSSGRTDYLRKVIVRLLPVVFYQQYNSKTPYGWNDGPMIPAKGYQTMISAGAYTRWGPLSLQLRPEYVYAADPNFETINIYPNGPDLPDRFGNNAYGKFFWGQSNIKLTAAGLSLALSTENLWWGPGKRSSLLMSNNAPGFKHLAFSTEKPLNTRIGSFEFQAIGAKLEPSGFSALEKDPKYSGWRYLSAFSLNYQPKWVKGLFLGMNRGFQAYRKDIKKLGDYIPFLTPFQKANTKDALGDEFPRDQLASFYARWLFMKAHAEVYLEYGSNDNAYDWKDFLGSPQHAQAYIFGLSKLITLKDKKDEFFEVNAEVTQLSQTTDRIVRGAGYWYSHFQIRQGYTHKGQVIGAGIGPGGNLQSIELNWLKGLKRIGVQLERYVHNDDYYEASIGNLNGYSRRWVDFSLAANGNWDYRNFIFTAKLQTIGSLNYQWKLYNYRQDTYYIPNNDKYNVQLQLSTVYRF